MIWSTRNFAFCHSAEPLLAARFEGNELKQLLYLWVSIIFNECSTETTTQLPERTVFHMKAIGVLGKWEKDGKRGWMHRVCSLWVRCNVRVICGKCQKSFAKSKMSDFIVIEATHCGRSERERKRHLCRRDLYLSWLLTFFLFIFQLLYM